MCPAVWVAGGRLAATAPLTSHATLNHWVLRAQTDAHVIRILSHRQRHSIFLDRVKSILGPSHHGRVRDSVAHVAGPLVVQDSGLLLTWHLNSLDGALVTARVGHLVAVHDNVFVALQELHLEAPSVDHGRALVNISGVQASIDCVVVARADLELDTLEVALRSAVQRLVRLHQ